MAGLTPPPAAARRLGRAVALLALAGCVGLGGYALVRVDARPRTHDAYLYADSAPLAPDVSGRIVAFYVKQNQRVAKGAPLLQIDPEPYALRVDEARARVAALEAQIALTGRQVQAQSSGADAAGSQVRRAEAQATLARATLARLTPLLSKGYVTAQQVDEARGQERAADAALVAARQQAQQARQAVGDTDSLRAQLDGARAALALAERDLRETVPRAPFDGVVVGLDLAPGAYAVAGHPLFTLIDTSVWYAVGDFRETELPSIAPGDRATVWTMADGAHPLAGHVESVGWGVRPPSGAGPGLPAVERTLDWVVVAQRFPVRVRLDTPPAGLPADRLRIGTTVSILVDHDRHR